MHRIADIGRITDISGIPADDSAPIFSLQRGSGLVVPNLGQVIQYGGGFSPLKVPGLKLWLEADRITGIADGRVFYNDPAGKTSGQSLTTEDFLKAWKKRFIVLRPHGDVNLL